MKFNISTNGIYFVALHRILTPEEMQARIYPTNDMDVCTNDLEDFIRHSKNSGIIFISIDEAMRLAEDKIENKYIVITVDDGYIDNYINLAPIADKHQVPICIYIVTGYPDDQCCHSFGILEDYMRDIESLDIEIYGKRFLSDFSNTEDRKDYLYNIYLLLEKNNNDTVAIRNILREINIPERYINKKRTLSWDNIVQLSKNQLFTIGSHTNTHPHLTKCADSDIAFQLHHSKTRLETMLNKSINHFSYPYGSHNEKTRRLVEAAGYKTAVTLIPKAFKDMSKLTLPRYWLNNNLEIININ